MATSEGTGKQCLGSAPGQDFPSLLEEGPERAAKLRDGGRKKVVDTQP